MKCTVCGCSEFAPCIDEATGETCAWIEFLPGMVEINGGGMCSFCAENRAEEENFGLDPPPLVELVSDYEADLFLRERRRA
jgi:hypothetical protein